MVSNLTPRNCRSPDKFTHARLLPLHRLDSPFYHTSSCCLFHCCSQNPALSVRHHVGVSPMSHCSHPLKFLRSPHPRSMSSSTQTLATNSDRHHLSPHPAHLTHESVLASIWAPRRLVASTRPCPHAMRQAYQQLGCQAVSGVPSTLWASIHATWTHETGTGAGWTLIVRAKRAASGRGWLASPSSAASKASEGCRGDSTHQ